jgi:hypothetical protein
MVVRQPFLRGFGGNALYCNASSRSRPPAAVGVARHLSTNRNARSGAGIKTEGGDGKGYGGGESVVAEVGEDEGECAAQDGGVVLVERRGLVVARSQMVVACWCASVTSKSEDGRARSSDRRRQCAPIPSEVVAVCFA